ncbi:VOC family protein [Fluviibacterium sp. DFM31]|uniref:VOC family protein n=1 Tax=Meridianimarinicoccus marinus TaxID=3231483 RepID=A0ABV3L1X5_9RHOB
MAGWARFLLARHGPVCFAGGMTLKALHHVALIASDLDASLAFYGDLLGFEVVDRNFRAARTSWKVDLRHPSGIGIELFTFPDAPPRPSRPEAQGLRHLAFAVTDLEAAIAPLKAAGIAVEPIRTDPYTGARFTFFPDPDGLPLEFYES